MRVHSEQVQQLAVASEFAYRQLRTASGRPAVLGIFPTACYLQLPAGAVIAVLTADAVQLPIGLWLPATSAQLPLKLVCEPFPQAGLHADGLTIGGLRIRVAAVRSTRLQPVGPPSGANLAACSGLRDEAKARADVSDRQLDALFDGPERAVAELLGRGPGLTPAGDDVLCGLLAGERLFGAPAGPVRVAVLARLAASTEATTSLSRQLLLAAADGHGIPQLASFGRALSAADGQSLATAWGELLAIGHSSGAALGLGMLLGAERVAASSAVSSAGASA